MIIVNVIAEAVDNLWMIADIDSLKPMEETGILLDSVSWNLPETPLGPQQGRFSF